MKSVSIQSFNIETLKIIKVNYRNTVTHPEEVTLQGTALVCTKHALVEYQPHASDDTAKLLYEFHDSLTPSQTNRFSIDGKHREDGETVSHTQEELTLTFNSRDEWVVFEKAITHSIEESEDNSSVLRNVLQSAKGE